MLSFFLVFLAIVFHHVLISFDSFHLIVPTNGRWSFFSSFCRLPLCSPISQATNIFILVYLQWALSSLADYCLIVKHSRWFRSPNTNVLPYVFGNLMTKPKQACDTNVSRRFTKLVYLAGRGTKNSPFSYWPCADWVLKKTVVACAR